MVISSLHPSSAFLFLPSPWGLCLLPHTLLLLANHQRPVAAHSVTERNRSVVTLYWRKLSLNPVNGCARATGQGDVASLGRLPAWSVELKLCTAMAHTVCKCQPHPCYPWWCLQGLISTPCWKWLGILQEKWLVIFTVWEKGYKPLCLAPLGTEQTRESHWQRRRCYGYLEAAILGFQILYCQQVPGWPLLCDCMWIMHFAIWKEGEDALVSDLMSY